MKRTLAVALLILVAGCSRSPVSADPEGGGDPLPLGTSTTPATSSTSVSDAEAKAAATIKDYVAKGTQTRDANYPFKTIVSSVTLDQQHPDRPVIGVSLAYTTIDEKMAATLNDLKHLRKLGGHDLTFKPGALKLLKNHPTLETIQFEGNTDLTAVTELSDGPAIKELVLGHGDFTAAHFEAIARVPSIKSIRIDAESYQKAYDLKAEMLRPLHKLPNLESLEYVIDDLSPENLAGFKSLKRLDCFAPNKSEAFFETLGKLPALRSLRLHWYYPDQNPTGPTGVAKLAALTELTELQVNFPLGDVNLKALTGLKQLQTLDLPADKFTTESIGMLAAFPRLTSLTLWYSDLPLSDEIVAKLKDLKGLKTLRLHIGPISEAGVVALSSLTELELLDLTGSKLKPNADKAMPHLAKLAKLQELRLGNHTPIANNIVTDAGLKELASLKKLKALRVWIGPFTEAGAAALSSLTELETLFLASPLPGASKAAPYIAKLTKLRVLDLSSANMLDVSELASLKALDVLSIRSPFGGQAPKGIDVLKKALPNLKVE